jgi:hypothetical protein
VLDTGDGHQENNRKSGETLIALAIKYLSHVLSVVPLPYCSPNLSSVALHFSQHRVVLCNNNDNSNNNTDSFVFLTYYLYETNCEDTAA